MLVLTRKVDEQIIIGGGIRITVYRLAGNRVSLAIEAPDDVRILRGELVERESPATGADAVSALQTA